MDAHAVNVVNASGSAVVLAGMAAAMARYSTTLAVATVSTAAKSVPASVPSSKKIHWSFADQFVNVCEPSFVLFELRFYR
jgi:Na+-driven multidrug efflux pump